jgi:hypothetical protein
VGKEEEWVDLVLAAQEGLVVPVVVLVGLEDLAVAKDLKGDVEVREVVLEGDLEERVVRRRSDLAGLIDRTWCLTFTSRISIDRREFGGQCSVC